MAGLFEYLGGAKKRKAQIDKTLQEGSTPQPSVRAQQQVKPKAKKKPYVAPKVPFEIRPGADTQAWLSRRKAEYDAQ